MIQHETNTNARRILFPGGLVSTGCVCIHCIDIVLKRRLQNSNLHISIPATAVIKILDLLSQLERHGFYWFDIHPGQVLYKHRGDGSGDGISDANDNADCFDFYVIDLRVVNRVHVKIYTRGHLTRSMVMLL